jgi:hypothetical protein
MPSHCEDKKCDQFNKDGNILISDQFSNRVIEVNQKGDIVWYFGLGPNDFSEKSIIGVNDAERLPEGLTLMAGTGIPAGVTLEAPAGVADNRVMIVDRNKKVRWQYGQFGLTGSGPNLLNTPVQATYLPCKCGRNLLKCGSVLITDQANNRIIRVSMQGDIIWQYPGTNTNPNEQLNSPNSAIRLKNKRYLIADEGNNRALLVDSDDHVIKIFTASGTLGACAFASYLDNGNVLLTDASNSKIIEVDETDTPVWQYITNADPKSIANPQPTRGLRLKNGNTIISNQYNNQVLIINKANVIVAVYGLPLSGATIPPANIIGTNKGYNEKSTQFGLYSPYDAKVISDFTGLTPPE